MTPSVEPLPLTGSTMIASRKGPYAIVVNADLSTVHFVHLPNGSSARDPALDSTVQLSGWPFKPVEDDDGVVHVLLRSSGELASIDRAAGTVRRTAVCANPRGLAAVSGANLLRVACADGVLVDVRASDGVVLGRADGPKDLRDVVVRNGRTFATTFRSARLFEVVALSDGGTQFALQSEAQPHGALDGGATAAVAWKTVTTPNGLLMLHQKARTASVSVTCAGYGGGFSASSIVTWDATSFVDDPNGGAPVPRSARCSDNAELSLVTDVALAPGSGAYALIGAGNALGQVGLFLNRDDATCKTFRLPASAEVNPSMRPLGVAFSSDDRVLVFTDEPALRIWPAISVTGDGGVQPFASDPTVVPLPGSGTLTQPRSTGHRLFHQATAAKLACASCHPEGHDDGQVWTFTGIGPRRTQSVSGGISTTAPFHWDGDMKDFGTLMAEVMGRRMLGPSLDQTRRDAVLRWIDSIPAARSTAKDAAAVARGKQLFDSTAGCNACHSGAKLTNNATADVGTGKVLQVPTLIGLGTRTPFMHDGCAKTLKDRFGPCGGGDRHGTTSTLSSAQIDDLVSYLETL